METDFTKLRKQIREVSAALKRIDAEGPALIRRIERGDKQAKRELDKRSKMIMFAKEQFQLLEEW